MILKNKIIGNKIRLLVGFSLLLSLITTNPFLTCFSLSTFWLMLHLLWKVNEPPILFAAFAMQWLQVSIKIFQANFLFVPIEDTVIFPQDVQFTIILSLISLIVIVTGISYATRKLKVDNYSFTILKLANYNLKTTIVLYISAIVVSMILLRNTFVVIGLQQFIVKIVDFKWVLFFILFMLSALKNKISAFLIILSFEIILGFTGYFSNFKDFIFITAIAYIFSKQKFSVKEIGIASFLVFALINFMIIWQNVKGDYRRFLSGGEKKQKVTVGTGEALDELSNLASDVNTDSYNGGAETLVDRIAYIDYFSATIDNSNRNNIFEHGKLWSNAVTNVFMPRFLFPSKASIDDSEKTRMYAGIDVAGAEQGTSISLGYVTETYVDFGPIWMFIPLLIFGVVIGMIYKFIVLNSFNTIWGFAFAVPLFFQLSGFENALDKIVGGLIAYFLVYLLLRTFFIKKIHRLLLS